MKRLLPTLLLGIGLLQANEALDVLEGNKKASEVKLPPAPEDSIVSQKAERESVVYIQPHWAPSPLDSVWAKAMLFEDPSNPWVQQAAITGFFDAHAAFGRATIQDGGGGPDTHADLDGSRTRRARLGARLRMFGNTEVEAVGEFAGSEEFRGIEKLSAQTTIQPGTKVKYGKFRPQFPLEHDDNEISAYPNRSMLSNMLSPRSSLGIMLSKTHADWEYGLGWFSSDQHPDLPGIEGDGFLAFNLARNFVEPAGITNRRMRWRLNYIHNFDANRSDPLSRYDLVGLFSANGAQALTRNPAYRHLVTTGVHFEQDNFSFDSEVMFGMGSVDRAWGLTLSPNYWLIPGTLKLVGRYHYAESRDAGGLISTMGVNGDPLFDSTPFFIGNEYESFYLGANLHLYENQMVLMGGLEQIELSDDAGAGYNTDASIWHLGAQMSF